MHFAATIKSEENIKNSKRLFSCKSGNYCLIQHSSFLKFIYFLFFVSVPVKDMNCVSLNWTVMLVCFWASTSIFPSSKKGWIFAKCWIGRKYLKFSSFFGFPVFLYFPNSFMFFVCHVWSTCRKLLSKSKPKPASIEITHNN